MSRTTPTRPDADTRRRARDALAAISRRQYGLITTAQVREAGASEEMLAALVSRGVLVRRDRGVYAFRAVPASQDAVWLAAQLALGPNAVLSHRTAASVHGLEHRLPDDGIHLLVRSASRRRRSHLVVHVAPPLQRIELSRVGPHRVTSVARTVCDLAGSLAAPAQVRRLVATAVRRDDTDADRIRQVMDLRGRFPGRAALRLALDELSPLEPVARGELESRFLRLMTRAGLPPTALNHPVEDADGRSRLLDAVWLPETVYAELDSRRYHGTLVDWHDDQRRENALALVGWRTCLRFSWWDLTDHPDQVVDTVRRALQQARDDRR